MIIDHSHVELPGPGCALNRVLLRPSKPRRATRIVWIWNLEVLDCDLELIMSLVGQLRTVLRNTSRVALQDLARFCGVIFERPQLSVIANQGGDASPNAADNDPLKWDGLALMPGLGGAPKHKPGLERRRKRKHDMRRFYPFLKSWHMLVPCDGCGGFKKKFHLCETCYDQTRYETQQVREKLKAAGQDLSQETVLKYIDDPDFGHSNKKVFNVERPRPAGWFSQSCWGK